MEKQRVIVGLGNPGKKYANTRHNMGFLVVQRFAQKLGWTFKEEAKFQAEIAKGKSQDTNLHLVLPLTYMNASGEAVQRYLRFFGITPDNLIVVCDDADLPFGDLRLRSQGSSGGHNGLKNIQLHLQTNQYVRLRMGIGRASDKHLVEHVLEGFTNVEQEQLPALLDSGVFILERLVVEDVSKVMNAVNMRRDKVNEQEIKKNETRETKPL